MDYFSLDGDGDTRPTLGIAYRTALTNIVSDLASGILDDRKESAFGENLENLLGTSLFLHLPDDAKLDLARAEHHFEDRHIGESGNLASQLYANCVETTLNNWLRPKAEELFRRRLMNESEKPKMPVYRGQWEYFLTDVYRLLDTRFDYSDWWPQLDPDVILQLINKLRDLIPARGLSHSEVPRMMANESRTLVLGTRVGGQDNGILELAARLAGKTTG